MCCLSWFYITVNFIFLVGQDKTFNNITLGSWKLFSSDMLQTKHLTQKIFCRLTDKEKY